MAQRKKKVLVLFAHPALEKSVVNARLIREFETLEGVTFCDLYEEYPDYNIDIQKQQSLLEEHPVIVFQHPLYWYSAPSLLKEWCDLVLEYGWAYGTGGDRLKGKSWVHAITVGGTEAAYHPEGFHHTTLLEFLRPWSQTAGLCGMNFLTPFALYGSLQLNLPKHLNDAALKFRTWVETLRDSHE